MTNTQTTNRIAQISKLMLEFRLAAKTRHIQENHVGYANFPAGSCTWASFAFGRMLKEIEPHRDWHLINASNDDPCKNHDWLEDGELAVDITADQYDPLEPYVGPAPPPSANTRPSRKRIELSTATPAHLAALDDIRLLMNPGRKIE